MKKVNSSQKTAIYHTLYLLNLSFARIVTHCQALHDAGVLRRKFNRLYQAYAQELQAEINDETLGTVSSIEHDDLNRFGRIRDARDKELRDLTTFSSMPKNAESSLPNNARNANSFPQFNQDSPVLFGRVFASGLAYGGDGGDDLGGAGVPPWIANHYQLVSWWDMERFSAESFYSLARAVEGIALHSRSHPESEVVPEEHATTDNKNLVQVASECKNIGLQLSAMYATELAEKAANGITFGERSNGLEILQGRIQDEMGLQLFLHVPVTRAERFNQEQAFGQEVFQSFPSASFDIKESGNCFVTARYTACAFHLMRVLEIGLVTFAKMFPAVPTNKENWQQIIEKTESEIRAMPNAASRAPDWKEKMEQYAQIANSFMFFKDAWRNYTAHARGKYTEDEADSIYRNVRSFMQGLTKAGLHE
jgi:hypothetical protein